MTQPDLQVRECKCNHTQPDYNCPCWIDGFETADAEECFEKIAQARKGTIEEDL